MIFRALLLALLAALTPVGGVSAATAATTVSTIEQTSGPAAQMPENVTPALLNHLRNQQLASSGPAGWSFNWFSYKDFYWYCNGVQCGKQVSAVEEYRPCVDCGVTYHRGYGSVRKLGATTGVKVERVAYSYNESVKAVNDTDVLDGGTCCATSRTVVVGVWEGCSFCGDGRASSTVALRYNGVLYGGLYLLSNYTERNFGLG